MDTGKRSPFPKIAYVDLRMRPSDTLARELSEGDMKGENMALQTNEILEGKGAVNQQIKDGGDGEQTKDEEPQPKHETRNPIDRESGNNLRKPFPETKTQS